MCEATAIIDNGPITQATNDPNDLEALAPNYLLLIKTQPNIPPGIFTKEDQYA